MKSIFETLNAIDCSQHTERKNGLTYLSWAWAWGILKTNYPNSFYTIYESANGWNYHNDGKTAWVKTGVTVVDGETQIEHIEMLPVMDFRNKSVSLDAITSFDVNKAIQRSLTKAVARHGLGLYIYAGEDLPADSPESIKSKVLDFFASNAKAFEYYGQKLQVTTIDGFTQEQYEKIFKELKSANKI